MLTGSQAQEGDLDMEVDDLALRPRISPIASDIDAVVPTGNTNATSSQAPSCRKRKASSIDVDGQDTTNRDALETQVVVATEPASILGDNDEVKLVLEHLPESTTPAPDAEDRTAAGTISDETVHLEVMTTQTAPSQPTAQIVPQPEYPRVDTSSSSSDVRLATASATHPDTAAPKDATILLGKAHLALVDESTNIAGVVGHVNAMHTTTLPVDDEARNSTDKGPQRVWCCFKLIFPETLERCTKA